MSSFDFTSQICTTQEQSERLLALGLKKETADCVMMYYDGWHIGEAEHFDFDKDPVEPAWSLHRLIDLCPHYRVEVGISYVSWDYRNEFPKDFTKHKDTYNNLIDCIEWLIKVGYFNKEYLEK
jgi:hypothetical protein